MNKKSAYYDTACRIAFKLTALYL